MNSNAHKKIHYVITMMRKKGKSGELERIDGLELSTWTAVTKGKEAK